MLSSVTSETRASWASALGWWLRQLSRSCGSTPSYDSEGKKWSGWLGRLADSSCWATSQSRLEDEGCTIRNARSSDPEWAEAADVGHAQSSALEPEHDVRMFRIGGTG